MPDTAAAHSNTPDERPEQIARLLNAEIQDGYKHYFDNDKVLELAEQCLASGPRAAATLAQSDFPVYARREKAPWRAQALAATLGFTDPMHPLSAAASHHALSYESCPHLNRCAHMLLERIQQRSVMDSDEAYLLCQLAASPTEAPAGAAFREACNKEPRFNPMRAIETLLDNGLSEDIFESPLDASRFARAMLGAPGWRPDSDLGLLQWLASACGPHAPSHGALLLATIASRPPEQRLASLLMLPRSWSAFPTDDSTDDPPPSLFHGALSRSLAGLPAAGELACATLAARHAAHGMAEFLSQPVHLRAPRPSIEDFCSGEARAWAFETVEPEALALMAPRDRGAWLDFSIASGRWRHAARAIDSANAKTSALALCPLAIARCLANRFLAPASRDNQALPFLRKAMRFSGRPAEFAAELAQAPTERALPPALLAKLFSASAGVERTMIKKVSDTKNGQGAPRAKRL